MTYALAQAQAPQPKSVTELLSGATQEFFSLHREMTALAPQTGIAVPSLAKAAAVCGVSTDEGATPLLMDMAQTALFGMAGISAGFDHAANLVSTIRESYLDQQNERNGRGQRSAANKQSAMSVLFGSRVSSANAAPKTAPAPANNSARAKEAQEAKLAKFMATMQRIQQLNDLKAMGVEMVVPGEDGELRDVTHTVKAKAPHRAFTPRFARPAMTLGMPMLAMA